MFDSLALQHREEALAHRVVVIGRLVGAFALFATLAGSLFVDELLHPLIESFIWEPERVFRNFQDWHPWWQKVENWVGVFAEIVVAAIVPGIVVFSLVSGARAHLRRLFPMGNPTTRITKVKLRSAALQRLHGAASFVRPPSHGQSQSISGDQDTPGFRGGRIYGVTGLPWPVVVGRGCPWVPWAGGRAGPIRTEPTEYLSRDGASV